MCRKNVGQLSETKINVRKLSDKYRKIVGEQISENDRTFIGTNVRNISEIIGNLLETCLKIVGTLSGNYRRIIGNLLGISETCRKHTGKISEHMSDQCRTIVGKLCRRGGKGWSGAAGGWARAGRGQPEEFVKNVIIVINTLFITGPLTPIGQGREYGKLHIPYILFSGPLYFNPCGVTL